MIQLEDLQPSAAVRGIVPDCLVSIVSVQWFGSDATRLAREGAKPRVAQPGLFGGSNR